CTDVLQTECDGIFRGRNTFCSTIVQPCCPLIYGDTNADGSVDMTDFAALQACLTTGGGTLPDSCKCLDITGDGAITGADMERFIACAGGPELPGTSGLVGDPPVSCRGVGW
ncbi:MAG: hypothetical protein HY718_15760, partial [Planctomycetes bacterium]|nr:hypothetical protein [Planctomycetota bacterium]